MVLLTCDFDINLALMSSLANELIAACAAAAAARLRRRQRRGGGAPPTTQAPSQSRTS